jgi:hypothetical protein
MDISRSRLLGPSLSLNPAVSGLTLSKSYEAISCFPTVPAQLDSDESMSALIKIERR